MQAQVWNPVERTGDLYFTLQYVAGYRGRYGARREWPVEYGWTPGLAEVKAQHAIDALLCTPLPEVVLWWERKRLEDKLFGPQRPYSPFL